MVLVVMMVPVVWMAMQPASGDSVVVSVGAVGGAKMTLIKAIFFCSGRHRSLASIDNCLDTTVSTPLLFLSRHNCLDDGRIPAGDQAIFDATPHGVIIILLPPTSL